MHDVTVKWIFFLLLVMAGKAATAEGITLTGWKPPA